MNEKANVKTSTIFDRKSEYQAKIEPLLNEITKICALSKIPFVCMCAVSDDGEHTKYIHSGVPAAGMGVNLTEDLFENYLLAINGGKFVPPSVLSDEDLTALEPPEGMLLREPNSRSINMEDFEGIDLDPEVVLKQQGEKEKNEKKDTEDGKGFVEDGDVPC